MTDTPTTLPTWPRASGAEQVKSFIGDLARPFAIISTSFGATWASVVVAYKVRDGNDAAFLMGAIFAGVASLYIGKAWEVAKTGKHAAEIEIAKTGSEPKP